MHKIYIDKGKFDFIYQLPQIIYSMLISIVINMIIKKLALSEKSVLEVKKIKKINELEMEKNEIQKQIKYEEKMLNELKEQKRKLINEDKKRRYVYNKSG